MKTIRMVVAALLVVTAGAAEAQQADAPQPPGADRVVAVLPARYSPPDCDAEAEHFKVSSAATYLKTGIETDVEENRARALENGLRVATEAIAEDNQGQSAGAWYILGRLYLQKGDVRGADSALSRVATLAPDCAGMVDTLRQVVWVPLVNAGIQFTQARNSDSAKALFTEANIIYRGMPHAFSALGVIYANAGEIDSAIVNLAEAARLAEANDMAEERNQATFNLAVMLSRAGRNAEAAAALEKYVAWVPKDIEAKRALAAAYRASGQPDKAKVIDDAIVAAGGTAEGGVASQDVFNVGVVAFNDKRYEDAAEAFDTVTVQEPWNRDAWYNLANAYLALNDPEGLIRAARKLTAIEPMNEDAIKMLGQGLGELKKQDEQLEVVEHLLALPTAVKIRHFTRTNSGATLTGTATGRAAMNAAGKKLPPAPVTLVFEFLDKKGTVVATTNAEIPALPAGETHDLQVQGEGEGIVAWRYTIGEQVTSDGSGS